MRYHDEGEEGLQGRDGTAASAQEFFFDRIGGGMKRIIESQKFHLNYYSLLSGSVWVANLSQ